MVKRVVSLVLLIIVLVPAILWALWYFKTPTKLDMLIFDKTVLTKSVQEHISLLWVLNNERYEHSHLGAYKPLEDYRGFFPDGKGGYAIKDIEKYQTHQLDSLANVNDVAYFTDMYGIYNHEWIAEYYPDSVFDERFISERSRRIYGGLSQQELNYLKLMKRKNKLIINEFNIIAHPTAFNIRRQYENEFGVTWSGWVGRYYDSLDTLTNMDIPRWLINNYLNQHNQKWPFTKSGIAFVREDDRVEILENETHLLVEIPYILTNKVDAEHYDISKKIKYPYWFDIVKADSGLHTISNYELKPNTKGDSILRVWKIPKVFPALVRDTRNYRFYYLAGDFCDNPITLTSSYFRHIDKFAFVTASNEISERVSFFWFYYRPLLKTILNEEERIIGKK